MADGNFITYHRVSTKRQGESGLGLEAQRDAISSYLVGGTGKLLNEFIEIESGNRKDRPELSKALELCKLTGSTLLISKIDRLARNVHFISSLMESGVDFIAADNPNANRLTVHILAAVAEDEARRISERTKAALKAAKARGVRLGGDRGYRPEGRPERALKTLIENANEFALSIKPIIGNIRENGQNSFREIAIELNKRGIKSARNGQWHASSVRNIEMR